MQEKRLTDLFAQNTQKFKDKMCKYLFLFTWHALTIHERTNEIKETY